MAKQPGTSNLTWVVDASLAADYTTPTNDVIDCIGYNKLTIECTLSPTSDPTGVLYLQGSGSGSLWGTIELEKLITSDSATIAIASGAVDIADPAASAMVLLVVYNPPPKVRIFYDVTSGGSTTGLDAAYWLELT